MANLTKHAAQRCQQRGIPPFIMDLIIAYGETSRRGGAELSFLTKESRRQLERDLGHKVYARIEDQLDVYIVHNDTEVITAAKRTSRIPR
jgi:hypothetical protein